MRAYLVLYDIRIKLLLKMVIFFYKTIIIYDLFSCSIEFIGLLQIYTSHLCTSTMLNQKV
jgi:hypothetical protein